LARHDGDEHWRRCCAIISRCWFDLRQRFGVIGPIVATTSLLQLALVNGRRALMAMLFGANVAFAYSGNPGTRTSSTCRHT
jgi:hypothetical protein